MRIVLLSPEYPPDPNLGGIGTYTATMAPALARRSHQVSVVTFGEPGTSTEGDVTVVRLEPPRPPHGVAARLALRARLLLAARSLWPDVVQAPEWEALAWLVARAGRVPVVTRLATPTYLVDELNLGRANPDTTAVRWMERDQTLRSGAVFGPSRAIVDRLSGDWGLPPGTVHVVPNPVDVGGVRRAGAAEPPVSVPGRSIVFLGRLERRKGIETLAEALPHVLGAHPDVEAVLVGRDASGDHADLMPRFRHLVAPVAERVHLTGRLSHEQAMAVAARASLVVLPSLWEAFGYVCVEAMALARPVVASAVGGFAEIVDDGINGWLVPPADAVALARTLIERLQDPEGCRRVGEAASRRAEDFAVDRVAEQLEEIYGGVLTRPRRATPEAAAVPPSIYRAGYRSHFRPDNPGPFHNLYQAKRDVVVASFAASRGLRILDAGGGYGRVSGHLRERHQVVLCDLAGEMLAEARDRWGRSLVSVQADARRLPFADATFGAAVALDLLVHLPDLHDGLRELRRVLRPGARLLVDSTNSAAWWVLAYPAYVDWRPRRLVQTMRSAGVLPEWAHVVRHQSPNEMRRALAGAGLRVEGVTPLGPRWCAKWHLWSAVRV